MYGLIELVDRVTRAANLQSLGQCASDVGGRRWNDDCDSEQCPNWAAVVLIAPEEYRGLAVCLDCHERIVR